MEEQKLLLFSTTKERLAKEQEVLEEIQKVQAQTQDQFKKLQESSFNASDVDIHLSYIKLFKEKERVQLETIKKVSREVDASRKALLEAVKERKIMENLKERQLREFNETMASHERKAADETAIVSFLRNKQ